MDVVYALCFGVTIGSTPQYVLKWFLHGLGLWHTQCEFTAGLISQIHCNIALNLLQCFSSGPMHTASIIHHKFADVMILLLFYPFHHMIFCAILCCNWFNCCMFDHLYDSVCVSHPYLFIQPYLYKITMNRRQAAAALLLYRRQKHCRYWVHPINQSHQQFGEFHTLYKDLRKYQDRFYTYYRMSTEQFDYIIAQIEHLIYKPNTNWQCSISAEENTGSLYQVITVCYHLKACSPYCTYYHPLGNNIVQRWPCLKFSQMPLYNSMYKYLLILWFLMIIADFYIYYNIPFVTSRYLATRDAITTIVYNFWIGDSTAGQIILDDCVAIWNDLGTNIYACAIRR